MKLRFDPSRRCSSVLHRPRPPRPSAERWSTKKPSASLPSGDAAKLAKRARTRAGHHRHQPRLDSCGSDLREPKKDADEDEAEGKTITGWVQAKPGQHDHRPTATRLSSAKPPTPKMRPAAAAAAATPHRTQCSFTIVFMICSRLRPWPPRLCIAPPIFAGRSNAQT